MVKKDSILNVFAEEYSGNVFKEIGIKMMDMALISDEWFKKYGKKEITFMRIEKKLDIIAQRVGVTPEGILIKDSYIDRLANKSQYKEQLKDYIIKGLNKETSFRDFKKGFRELIESIEETDYKLLKEWETVTHDLFIAVSRNHDDIFAQALGLNFFIYLPGAIESSRSFCKGGEDFVYGNTFECKIGQCFHRLDMAKWSNQNWSGKSEHYDPITDMGGYGCRHSPAWINNGTAKRMFPEKYYEYEK